jgi:hypothetical protein
MLQNKERLKVWLAGTEDFIPEGKTLVEFGFVSSYDECGVADPSNTGAGSRFIQRIKEGGSVQEYQGIILARKENEENVVQLGDRCCVGHTFLLGLCDKATQVSRSKFSTI